MEIDDLSLQQKILMMTDGTVTDLIGLYAGESIRVIKVAQRIVTDAAPAVLHCAPGERILQRQVLLSGASQRYLYADSQLVVSRLSASIQSQLLETDKPIGLMWKTQRLESYREVIDRRIEPGGDIARHFSLGESTLFAARTYVVVQHGLPIGMITEKWPTCYFCDL